MTAELQPHVAKALFPPGTAVCWSAAAGNDDVLFPPEERATSGMAARRRAVFAQGRHCAHDCLRQLGFTDVPLPVGEQRAPLWPPGVVGSISHCDGRAVAAAAREEVAAGLGIDLEARAPLEQGVLELVCTAAERDWLAGTDVADTGRLVFTIKESIYKCLWTRVRRFIDFQEVAVAIDEEARSFTAGSVNEQLDDRLVRQVRGHYAAVDGFWLAGCYLPSSPMR